MLSWKIKKYDIKPLHVWYKILIFKDKHILKTTTTIKMVARFSVCYSLTEYNRATYYCISLESTEWVNLYFFCSSWFCMTWGSVAEGKCHHMTPCTSLDNLTRLIAIGTAIMTNVCHLLYHTSTGITFDFVFTPSGSTTSIPVILRQNWKRIKKNTWLIQVTLNCLQWLPKM